MQSMNASGSGAFRTITGGSYEFLMPLAEGGMGRVDVVMRRDGGFRRLYALKRLHSQFRDDGAFRAMFLDEARIAGLLRHPNVVSVLDVGEDDDGPFLVMDYVEGVPLNAVLRRLHRTGQNLPIQLVVAIVAQAAHGLHAAHELTDHDGNSLGLVHRDVSPQNVLVSFNGVVQMTDFGVAKALGRTTKTESGVLKGKYGYMSPEQLRFRDIDRRSDLFSLGVILFELIAARRLYAAGDVPAPRRILEEAPPDVGDERDDLMPELVELCFELLAKAPEARPRSAKVVAERLEEIGRTLAIEEGRVELSDYMSDQFGGEQSARQSTIQATIADLLVSSAQGVSARRNRRRSLATVTLLALLLAGVLAFVAFDNATAENPAQTTTTASVGSQPAPNLQEADSVPPATEPDNVVPSDMDDEPASEPVGEPVSEPASQAMRARPSMRRSRNAMASDMGATMEPIWPWPGGR